MKKFLSYILILIVLIGIFVPIQTHASVVNPKEQCTYDPPSTTPNNQPCESAFVPGTNTPVTPYQLLAPLPGVGPDFNPQDKTALGKYLNVMIKLIIGLSAVFAVVMIVIGGIEYMTSELISSKEAGKEKIKDALLGLLIALGAYALLNTINPDLLNSDITISDAVIQIDLEADVEQTPVNGKYGTYAVGANWQAIAGNPFGLPPFASINRRECKTVGEKFCTSTAGLDTTPLYRIHEKCPSCQLKVNGGTEFWLHGGKTGSTSHNRNSSTMDLALDAALNKYIAGDKPLIYFHRYTNGDGYSYLYEGNHWHVGP